MLLSFYARSTLCMYIIYWTEKSKIKQKQKISRYNLNVRLFNGGNQYIKRAIRRIIKPFASIHAIVRNFFRIFIDNNIMQFDAYKCVCVIRAQCTLHNGNIAEHTQQVCRHVPLVRDTSWYGYGTTTTVQCSPACDPTAAEHLYLTSHTSQMCV